MHYDVHCTAYVPSLRPRTSFDPKDRQCVAHLTCSMSDRSLSWFVTADSTCEIQKEKVRIEIFIRKLYLYLWIHWLSLQFTAGSSRQWAPGPNLGPWPTFFGPFRFKIYALNLGIWALSQLMTTIGHKKFESVQLYRESVLMYSTVCKSLHFRGSVTY